jgi:hypothetical protein
VAGSVTSSRGTELSGTASGGTIVVLEVAAFDSENSYDVVDRHTDLNFS